VLVAGEQSGDQLGAGLMHALRERFPSAQFFGVGGPLMQAAGLEAWFDASELAVMGLWEVLSHLPRLLRRRAEVIARTLALRPTLYIGIDAPDFNLAIERKLKAQGVLTTHYVSPSIWAWRHERAAKIGQSADLVLCLFPFEPALYEHYGVRARFVGHPLADQFPLEPTPMFARTALGLPLQQPVLAILPGSRKTEVKLLAKPFLDAAAALKARFPRMTVIAPMANAQVHETLRAQLEPHHSVLLLEGQAKLALQAADAVIVASGTAALEAALARKPMVVCYRVSAVTYFIARRLGLLKTAFFSLPNKLAERALVPELEQDQVQSERIAALLESAFAERFEATESANSQGELQLSYLEMHLSLKQDADVQAANAIIELLTERKVLDECA
jgi:lipid-A-disaccharide synthase